MTPTHLPPTLIIRHDLQPGDIGLVVTHHARWYKPEFDYDHRFEGYVARTMGEFVIAYNRQNDRLWMVEDAGQFVGCIAIVGRPGNCGQLRWFLLHEQYRGRGLGKYLIGLALDFCRERGFDSVYLLTTNDQLIAHRLYGRSGFVLTHEDEPTAPWGPVVREQRYELAL
ncbi:MAG: GNAT family N-acetyltransferase [Cytophagales bacterium]|nr:MAG: GNAT family N-acetyltransferase [Cytophagales bacterium]